MITGWKPLHIAVFETKIEEKIKTENNDVNEYEKDKKDKKKGAEGGKGIEGEGEEHGNRRNPDGTMRGVLVAVCPLYVKYNR
jgi:hypothetical protein